MSSAPSLTNSIPSPTEAVNETQRHPSHSYRTIPCHSSLAFPMTQEEQEAESHKYLSLRFIPLTSGAVAVFGPDLRIRAIVNDPQSLWDAARAFDIYEFHKPTQPTSADDLLKELGL